MRNLLAVIAYETAKHYVISVDTGSCGPAQTLKQIPAAFIVGETRHEIDKSHSSSHQ